MLFYLLPSDLPSGEIHKGNIALRKSDKPTNCHVAAELQGRTTDIRTKPDWLNDNLSVVVETLAEGSYLRQTMAPCYIGLSSAAGTCHGETAISGEKGESRVRQSVTPIVTMRAKRRLPKSEHLMVMNTGSEYPIWQRSVHSSPSKGKPCTWRRDAVDNFSRIEG
jgi:hypothetical protein